MSSSALRLFVCSSFAALAINTTAMAVSTSPGFSLSVFDSVVFDGSDWDINGANLVSGQVKNASGVGNQYKISFEVAGFSWGTHPLTADLNPGGPLAEASFGPGGTMVVTGTVRLLDNTPLFTGTLLEADVITGFDIRESDANNNIVNSINNTIKIQPTGGWLHTTAPDVRLDGIYDFALIGPILTPLGGGSSLDDFSGPLSTSSPTVYNFNLVPEPASLLGLGLIGSLALLRRKRS